MRYNKLFKALRRSSVSGSALLFSASTILSGSAIAQDSELQEIMVTGSRIQRNSMTTPTPVTALSSDDLSNMAPGNLIEAFDQVPQFQNNESPQTQTNYAGAAGASNLNLRGINAKRTLVLLDGRRVVGSNRLGSVDINLFPESMIERVEVVTGGASAAYGTDAVAGVTNFMLDTDFTGFRTRAQTGVTSRGDANNSEAAISFGTELGDRAHIIGSLEYYERDGIAAYPDRDWYQGWGTVTNPEWLETGNGPRLIVAPQVVSTTYTFGGLITQPESRLNRLMFQPDGSTTPFVTSDLSNISGGTGSQSVINGGSGDNVEAETGGQGGLIPDNDRASAFVYADYDLTDNVTMFLQAISGKNRTYAIGNSPVMFSNWGGTIYDDNAYLPQNVRDIMAEEGLESFSFSRMHSKADLGGGFMQTENRTDSITGGFNAEISNGMFAGWEVDGYYQYGRNDNEVNLIDFLRTDRLFQSLDAVTDPSTGEIVCRAALVGNPNYSDCVPVNLFGVGNASPEAVDYLRGPNKVITENIRQRFAEISANGEIWGGWGAGAIGGAVGASYREDSINKTLGPDDLIALSTPENNPGQGIQGIPPGFNGDEEVFQFSGASELSGSYEVREVFGELLIPVVANVTGAEQLDLNLSARWADYSGSGGIWSYKGGIDWQVYSDLRLRGTYSRDIRAANLSERFDAQGQGASADDPVFNNENYAFSQIIGGNPNVNPEEADTVTFGFIYQPGFLPGLSTAIDYYNIEIDGVIEQLGVQRIVNDCFNGAQDLCSQITRNPDTNRIVQVENVFLNINQLAVSGIDLEASYSMEMDLIGDNLETLDLRFLGTYLAENSITNLGAAPFDRAGEVGASGLPEYRWTLSANYTNGPFSAFVQQRYVGEGNLDNDYVEGVDINDNSVDAAWYTDLRLSYEFEQGIDSGTLELFANVNNVFDEAPPISANYFSFFGSTQVNESLHDVLGRRYTAGFTYTF